ncbi:MAG: peptidoglycan-binding domain-containing protein [Granulicella sp.]
MRFGRTLLATSLLCTLCVPAFAMKHSRRGPTSPKMKHTSKATRASNRSSSQRAIDDTRATAIQAALVKQGYLTGETSGHWDSQTEAAMQKMQADNGWQTKLIPDSRAIIKLGLGPNHDSDEASLQGSEISTQ